MPINQYTRELIKPRQFARTDNPQAIQDAGATAVFVGQVADIGIEFASKAYQAEQRVKLNDSMITYQQSLMDLQEEVRQETMDDPQQFEPIYNKRLQEVNKAFEESFTDRRTRFAFQESAKGYNFKAARDNKAWVNGRRVEIMASTLEEDRDKLGVMAYRGGDVDELIKNADASAIAAEGLLKPEAIDEYVRSTKASIVENKLISYLEKGQTGAAKSLLDSGDYDDFLGADGLSRGYNAVNAKIKEQREEAKRLEVMQSIIDRDVLSDPSNVEHRKAANEVYEKSGIGDAFAQMDLVAQKESIDLVNQTSIIPETMQSQLRSMMINGESEEKAFAYSTIAEIEESNPQALRGAGGFSKEEINNAMRYNAFIRSGASPDNAARYVAEAAQPLNKDVREIRAKNLSGKDGLLANIGYMDVERALSEKKWLGTYSFPDNETLKQQASADYKRIYEAEYLSTGNDEQAKKFANSQIKRKYGVDASTNKVMAYPPTEFYSIDGFSVEDNARWMQDQLKREVKNYGYNTENITLVPSPDARGLVDNGVPPSYYVFDGDNIVLGENNLPMQFVFDQEDGLRQLNETKEKRHAKKVQAGLEKRLVYESIEELPTSSIVQYLMKRGYDLTSSLPRNDGGQNVDARERLYSGASEFLGID